MSLQIINPLDCPSWDTLVLTQDGPSVFSMSGWAKVLHESYGYQPVYCQRIRRGVQTALLPVMEVRSILTGVRAVSMPFSDYCEIQSENQDDFWLMINEVIGYGRKRGWRYLELRGGQQYFSGKLHCKSFTRHTLRLKEDKRDLLNGFRGSTVRNIKKAVESGVEASISTSLESLHTYYQLHCLTRRRQGVPPQPLNFFRNIHNYILSKGHGFVVIATFNRIPIAGAVYFHFGREAVYKFGASDTNYQHLRANNLVMWEAIKWFALHGYSSFSFGRTDIGHEGLRQFKNGWGTCESVQNYYRINVADGRFISRPGSASFKYDNFIKQLPALFQSLIGNTFYRHMG